MSTHVLQPALAPCSLTLHPRLFSHLEEEQHRAFANALTPKVFSDSDVIIRQGDPGDYFYIVDSGVTDIFVRRKDGSETKVSVC